MRCEAISSAVTSARQPLHILNVNNTIASTPASSGPHRAQRRRFRHAAVGRGSRLARPLLPLRGRTAAGPRSPHRSPRSPLRRHHLLCRAAVRRACRRRRRPCRTAAEGTRLRQGVPSSRTAAAGTTPAAGPSCRSAARGSRQGVEVHRGQGQGRRAWQLRGRA